MSEPAVTREEAHAAAEEIYRNLEDAARQVLAEEPDIMYALPKMCVNTMVILRGEASMLLLAYTLLRAVAASEPR